MTEAHSGTLLIRLKLEERIKMDGGSRRVHLLLYSSIVLAMELFGT